MSSRPVAVIGAGIAGLSVAYRLSSAGVSVSLFEARDYAGGVIRSERTGGYLIEHGPNSMQPDEAVRAFLAEIGLTDRIAEANPHQRNRYVVREGSLVRVPLGPADLIRTRLFSVRGKLRLLAEPFVPRGDGLESVADFVERRVGREFLDFAINPFVAGVFAGDPARLSMAHAFPRMREMEAESGSLIRAMLKRRRRGSPPGQRPLISFKDGMVELPNRLMRLLTGGVRLSTPVRKIERIGSDWRLVTDDGNTANFAAIVSTVPLHQLDRLGPAPPSEVPEVTYPPLSVVALGYARMQIAHQLDGFGVLIPAVESQFRILGALFSSSLFPGRAPDGHVLLTVFLGGMRHGEDPSLATVDAIRTAQQDVKRLLGITGEPHFRSLVHWPHAIPQYDLAYDQKLARLSDLERRHPGLFLAGNYRGGISVGDTIRSSLAVATRVHQFVHLDHESDHAAPPI